MDYALWKELKSIPNSAKFALFFANTAVKITYTDKIGQEHEMYFSASDDLSFGSYIWDNFEFFQEFCKDEDGLSAIISGRYGYAYRPSTTEDFKTIKTDNNNRKDNDFMNFNFDFGPLKNDNVRMSIYGLAIKNTEGVWVSYDKTGKQIMDVDIFNFDGRKFMYKVPVAVKDIAVGDVVIHKRVPMFVESVKDGIHVVDVFAGEKKEILPTKSMFGFDFITKIVSLFDMNAITDTANESNPFGNNMWMFALMDKSSDDMLLPLMLMSNNGNNNMNFTNNPLMLMMLCDNKDKNSLLPFLLMSNNNMFGTKPNN